MAETGLPAQYSCWSSCEPHDLFVTCYETVDLVGKRLKGLAMLPLIARPGIDRRCALRDVSVTENNAHNMRRKPEIAEQCCHGAAEIVSVPA